MSRRLGLLRLAAYAIPFSRRDRLREEIVSTASEAADEAGRWGVAREAVGLIWLGLRYRLSGDRRHSGDRKGVGRVRALQPQTKITAALLLQSVAGIVMAGAAAVATIWRLDVGHVDQVHPLSWAILYTIPFYAGLVSAVGLAVCALGIRRNWRGVRPVAIAFEAVAVFVGAALLINGYVQLEGKAASVLAIALAVYAIAFLRGSRRPEAVVLPG
ncbi:hypothetical protein J5X84_37660 [Streptosporangiaceae bacterium NEAU-GS5]|nr:hypothetical protein [Streptosporangiaceae bacterium NEAU-GS5]